MVKLSDIARELGVSTATISNALAGKGRMKAETRQQIRDTALAMGYAAPAPSRSSHGQIMVITEAGEVSFSSEIVCGLSCAGRDAGIPLVHYDLSVLRGGPGRDASPEQLRPLIEQCISLPPVPPACLVYVAQYPRPLPGLLKDIGIPAIEVYCHDTGAPVSVNYDDQQGAYQAVSHLIATGCRNIAMLSGPVNNVAVSNRMIGYQRALIDHGLAYHPKLVWIGNWEVASGSALAHDLLTAATRPDAIFAQNDAMAVGALHAARALELDIPGDLSIVGFDNTMFANWTLPELTSVAPPFHEMGRAAFEQALALIQGATASAKLLLPCTLAQRGSTRVEAPA